MGTKGIIDEEEVDLKDLPVDIARPNIPEQEEDWGSSLTEDPRKPRRGKLIIVVVAVAVLLGIGAWALLHSSSGMEYRTAPVVKGNIESTVSATGSTNAVVSVQVGSQVSGNISALYADFNTQVKKGQLVARIDPELFQARVNQAEATVNAAEAAVVNAQAGVVKAQAQVSGANAAAATAKANVSKAQVAVDDGKVKYDRNVTLAKEGVVSPNDLDTSKATYDSAVASLEAAKADAQAANDNVNAAQADLEVARTQLSSARALVKQDQAALAQAQLDLAHTYIRAPVDGIVVSRNVDVGQTVAASLQAPTLFLIAQDLTKMQVDTNVSEADVGRVKLNQPATFTVDAYPGTVFHGQVWQIRKAPINVQNVITYDVVIAVSNSDLKLFPGMTANVKILVDQRENVLKVPNAALRFQPPEAWVGKLGASGRHAALTQSVWVLEASGKAKPIPVNIGITDGTDSEVTGGNLKPGDKVLIAAFPKSTESAGSPFSSSSRGPRL